MKTINKDFCFKIKRITKIIVMIRNTIIYYYILLYTIIYYYILLYTIIYYYILLYTIIYYYILLIINCC